MKTSLKIVGVVAVFALSGCTQIPRGPITPYDATAMTDWAKGVKGAKEEDVGHLRSFEIQTRNGRITYNTDEVASSVVGKPIRPPQPVIYMNPYGLYPY